MNQNSVKNFQIGLSEISRLLMPFAVLWLLGAIGLGWLVKSFLILIALILITPILAIVGFQWWLKRNLVDAACPVCQFQFTGLKGTEFRCPSCNEPLKVENGTFNRLTPPGTIDVTAVEVPSNVIDDK